MRTLQFWKVVERLPWIFRFFGFQNACIGVADEWLGTVLVQDIPHSVEWIAVRPFNESMLCEKSAEQNSKGVRSNLPDYDTMRIVKGWQVHEMALYVINWSLVGELPHNHSLELEDDRSFKEAIVFLQNQHPGKVIIDALVKINYRHAFKLEPGSSRRLAYKEDPRTTNSFDVYLF